MPIGRGDRKIASASGLAAGRLRLDYDELVEDRAEVDHRLPQVLGLVVAVVRMEHRVAVSVALDDLRMVDGDMCHLMLRVGVGRIAAILEDAMYDALCGAGSVLWVADEAGLGLPPLVDVAVARGGRERPDVELLVLLLDVGQVPLGARPTGICAGRSGLAKENGAGLRVGEPGPLVTGDLATY